MAHPWLWLTACGIVVLCVAVPHAFCHPTPDDSKKQLMPYYQQAQEPEHYYPAYDEEEEETEKEKINLQDFEPVLADKPISDETKYLNSRLTDLAILLGYIYFLWNVFRPENFFPTLNGRALEDQKYSSSYNSNVTNNIMSDAFTLVMNRVDPVEMGLNMLSVDAEECRNRLVCEARTMVTSVPLLDSLAQQHGWLLGSVPSYQEALSEGRSRGNCGHKYSQCPSTQLTRFYNLLR